jgi:hypothetical protein
MECTTLKLLLREVVVITMLSCWVHLEVNQLTWAPRGHGCCLIRSFKVWSHNPMHMRRNCMRSHKWQVKKIKKIYSFKNQVFISSLMKEDDLWNISKHMFCLVKLKKNVLKIEKWSLTQVITLCYMFKY